MLTFGSIKYFCREVKTVEAVKFIIILILPTLCYFLYKDIMLPKGIITALCREVKMT